MAVQYNPQTIDFSALAGIGQNLGGALGQHNLGTAMQDAMTNGSYDYDKMISVLAGRMPLAAAKLATQKFETEAEAAYRNAVLGAKVAEANRPPGPTTAMQDAEYFAGLPEGDPRRQYAPRGGAEKPREFSVADTDKLGDEAGSANELAGLITNFKKDYGGYSVPGQLGMAKAGYPTMNDTDVVAAQWWDDYGLWVEKARNELYKANVSPADRAEFEKSRVTPKTDPSAITKNLRKQHGIMARNIQRKRDTLKASNFDPVAIDTALKLDELPAEEAVPPTAGGPQVVKTSKVLPDGTVIPPTEASAAPAPAPGGAPSPPPKLRGRALQFNSAMNLFKDKSTGELFNVNGDPVASQ
jgi:hypothetical protein